MQIYFDSEFVNIAYREEDRVIIGAWKTTPTSEEFRTGMNYLLEAMMDFKTGKILADTIYMGAVHPDDQNWSATDWNRRAIAAGFSHNAIVVPSDIFTEMSVEAILDQVGDNGVVNRFFYNMPDALDWIKKTMIRVS